jgi:ATP-dependent Lon protease
LVAFCSCHLDIVVSPHNALLVAEHAIAKGATTLLIPVSARKQLNELTDEMVTNINILFCADIREALLKRLAE